MTTNRFFRPSTFELSTDQRQTTTYKPVPKQYESYNAYGLHVLRLHKQHVRHTRIGLPHYRYMLFAQVREPH